MSWSAVIECIERQCGPQVAALIDDIGRKEFGGDRIYVPARRPITPEMAHEVAPHEPRKAAKILDVHPATIYRILRGRRSLIR